MLIALQSNRIQNTPPDYPENRIEKYVQGNEW